MKLIVITGPQGAITCDTCRRPILSTEKWVSIDTEYEEDPYIRDVCVDCMRKVFVDLR